MKAPQIIVLVLEGISLLWSAYKHKQAITTNFWSSLVANATWIGLLIWGGFFK